MGGAGLLAILAGALAAGLLAILAGALAAGLLCERSHLAGALAAGLLRERSHFRWRAGVVGLLVVLVDALGVAV